MKESLQNIGVNPNKECIVNYLIGIVEVFSSIQGDFDTAMSGKNTIIGNLTQERETIYN